jgi:2-(1,2-epoxy-1,2-dihydrophenyl)acetyl-CoA isomerase
MTHVHEATTERDVEQFETASPGLTATRDEAGVLTLTLDAPETLNALTSQVAGALLREVEGAAQDPRTRCIVITGAGRAFCAGQDLRSDDRFMGVDVLLAEHYNPLITSIAGSDIPVIAALNGIAAGIGASLALACDIRVASASASLAFLFSRVGLAGDGGASYFLPRLTSTGVAADLMLLGGRLSAEEARAAGLVSRVLPDEEFRVGVEEIARSLADGPSGAYALIKSQLRQSSTNDLVAQLQVEVETQSVAVASAEYQEGRAAFLEKRRADFRSCGA